MSAEKRERGSVPQPGAAIDHCNPIEIDAAAFKNRCLELMDQVRDHAREYVITKHGRPVAKLVPLTATGDSAFGYLRGTVVEQGDIVSADPDAWEDPA